MGSAIARELKLDPSLGYYPLGFVDDNPGKLGIKINGVKVLGGTDALSHLIRKYEAECVSDRHPFRQGLPDRADHRQVPAVEGQLQNPSADERAS